MAPHLITIPTNDAAFRHFVERALGKSPAGSPREFEARLRRTHPRASVRERGLTGEAPSWYVYRDGSWREPDGDRWWDDPAVPRIVTSADGWMEEMNAPARALLAVEGTEPRHFTDFVVPGGLDDAIALFDIVRTTGLLEATVLLQPTTGDAMAVDARVTALDGGNGVVGVFRLASDIDAAPLAMNWPRLPPPERVDYLPPTDVAFRTYADRALARMPEPTIDGFTLRLRRLYPHAHVEAERTSWVAHRDRRESEAGGGEPWWRGENLPRVQYDALALILAANDQATAFFGQPLVGRHWQELVTAGSTEEVAAMLEILAEVGAAESRFRMPRGDGSLVEFDSYTEAQAGEFSTVFRPIPDPG